jgi:hypothetical protein
MRLRGVIATTLLHRFFPGCGEVWRRDVQGVWRDQIRRRATSHSGCAFEAVSLAKAKRCASRASLIYGTRWRSNGIGTRTANVRPTAMHSGISEVRRDTSASEVKNPSLPSITSRNMQSSQGSLGSPGGKKNNSKDFSFHIITS